MMMTIEALRTLYTYHLALHDQLWQGIEQLTDEQFVAEVPYSIGSVRNHLVHLMSVDQRWVARVQGAALPDRLAYDDYPTRAAVRATWDPIMAHIKQYVMHALAEVDLARSIRYTVRRPQGTVEHASTVWEILVHVVNHGTDHRAQLLRVLHDFGASTFEQDMMVYWWGEVD